MPSIVHISQLYIPMSTGQAVPNPSSKVNYELNCGSEPSALPLYFFVQYYFVSSYAFYEGEQVNLAMSLGFTSARSGSIGQNFGIACYAL